MKLSCHAPSAPRFQREQAFSLVEAAMATAIIALFLGSMFTLNSAVMRLVRNSKESANAMLSNQQRIEQLRSCNWSQLTDKTHLRDAVMFEPTQTGSSIPNATEVLVITEEGFVSSGTPAMIQVTRTPGSGSTITAVNEDRPILNAYLLRVDVTLTWQTLGGRTRTRTSGVRIARGGLTINETTTISPAIKW